MDDREKVIRGLRCLAGMNEMKRNPCMDCGYQECQTYAICIGEIARDALSLLKAQAPRVLTIAELWHMDHKAVYLERKNSRLYMTEPSIILKTERCYIPSLEDSYILMRENKIHDKYLACDYNKTWRCWTSRPTDEQREATPWNV